MYKRVSNGLFISFIFFCSCTSRTDRSLTNPKETTDSISLRKDTLPKKDNEPVIKDLKAEDIHIRKELLYDKYTLPDSYPYKDTTRQFQWDKIKERLAILENIQQGHNQWVVLQNYKNRNGEAPLVRKFHRNAYRRIADTLGVERYQSVPLYLPTDSSVPERYAHDGELARLISTSEKFVKVEPIYSEDEWNVPKKYVKLLSDSVIFNKAIVVDRYNQNIVSLERSQRGNWLIRSMNPVTTGRHRPPYAQETPLGIFVIQDKRVKMVFLKDGSQETGGYAPCASRFTDGAYIHGVPVNSPSTAQIEYSTSLGTTPRSHMCVRNATSHAKFIYEWASVNETIVFVIE